ncbi:hypothetical protein ACFVR1_11390 [Psychrobacillus sp. NPDC058041]|uniref:hypothetical protein n=1 Tax=Psychrobacillus sp. NPDC058041 TaxID=3346310 RepID=UPI0036DD6309
MALARKVHDDEMTIDHIDKFLIELDAEGKVTKVLDERLKTLKESKHFLFVPEGQQTTIIGRVIPSLSNNDYGKQFAEERSKGNEGLDPARKTYF